MADDFDPPSRKAAADKQTRGGRAVSLPSGPGSGAIRPRHDGFTPAKQRKFFKALKKCGCVKDSCRAAGISKTTVDRWRDKDAAFDGKVAAARAMASAELDMIAWQRATQGCEEKIYRDGKLVSVRVKPSDAILRLLMQGANPEKYGRTGQRPPPKDKALMKRLKKEAGREVRAAYRAGVQEELAERAVALLGMMKRRREKERLAAGWTRGPDGKLVVPPGWRMVRVVPLLLPSPPAPPEDRPA
jgi:hypothetical protein